VAINEIYGATGGVAEHGSESTWTAPLAVVGNSVGGNMAAVTALDGQGQGRPAIKAQVVLAVTNANFENASYDEFRQGHFLTRPMMKFWDAYTTDANQRKDLPAAAGLAGTLKGLPRR
jgi:acetyl esterase/lipase